MSITWKRVLRIGVTCWADLLIGMFDGVITTWHGWYRTAYILAYLWIKMVKSSREIHMNRIFQRRTFPVSLKIRKRNL